MLGFAEFFGIFLPRNQPILPSMTRLLASLENLRILPLFCFVWLIGIGAAYAQSDREQIITLRKASNAALKAFEHEQFLSYLTDDVHVTTGNGTLVQGKESLRKYIAAAIGTKTYFVRTAHEILVNTDRGLAWETGIWKGYAASQDGQTLAEGKYSAMWTKESGKWLIKSELFVALE